MRSVCGGRRPGASLVRSLPRESRNAAEQEGKGGSPCVASSQKGGGAGQPPKAVGAAGVHLCRPLATKRNGRLQFALSLQ